MNPTSPTTPSVEPARPAWIKSAVDEMLFYMAYREDGVYFADEKRRRFTEIILKHAPASLQSPAPAQPVTATRELVLAADVIAGLAKLLTNDDGIDPEAFWLELDREQANLIKLVASQVKESDAAHKATRSLAAGQSGGVK